MAPKTTDLGRDPKFLENPSRELRASIVQDVLANFAEGISYESCCWAADIDPAIFSQWRQENPKIQNACLRELARLERAYVRTMRGRPDDTTGEKPTSAEMKFAHEALKQTNKAWAPRQSGASIAQGLEELSKILPSETYALVVSTLAKNADS